MKTEILNKTSVLETLKDVKPKLVELGVNKVGLFGSYVRNEENEESDIDILIRKKKALIIL